MLKHLLHYKFNNDLLSKLINNLKIKFFNKFKSKLRQIFSEVFKDPGGQLQSFPYLFPLQELQIFCAADTQLEQY